MLCQSRPQQRRPRISLLKLWWEHTIRSGPRPDRNVSDGEMVTHEVSGRITGKCLVHSTIEAACLIDITLQSVWVIAISGHWIRLASALSFHIGCCGGTGTSYFRNGLLGLAWDRDHSFAKRAKVATVRDHLTRIVSDAMDIPSLSSPSAAWSREGTISCDPNRSAPQGTGEWLRSPRC